MAIKVIYVLSGLLVAMLIAVPISIYNNPLPYQKGDKVCVLGKEVTIRFTDELSRRYHCYYVDNNGIIQTIDISSTEATKECK